jgi:hypothetical protein
MALILKKEKKMKGFTKKTITAIVMTATALASVSSFASNYQPSTDNQVGRNVDHNRGDTYVNPNLYKSLSVADGNLRSLKYYEDDITEEMGYVIAYGNNLKDFNEFIGTRVIHGDLKIHDNPLEHTYGFQNIEYVGGSIHMSDTRIQKGGLDGFLKVKGVGGDFIMSESTFKKDAEVDARGVAELVNIGGELRFSGIKITSSKQWKLKKARKISMDNTGQRNASLLSNVRNVVDINLKGNPLIDISDLHRVEVEGHILIDKSVANNPNFRGMSSSALLCQSENTKHFHPEGLQQEQACEQ